jgi:hypothetical protein
MEEKLQSYRLRKRRLDTLSSFKEKFLRMVSLNVAQNTDDVKVKIEVIILIN